MSQTEKKPVWFLAHPDRRLDPGSGGTAATLVTVAIAYLSSFIAVGTQIDPPTWLLLLALGAVCILFSLPVTERWFFHSDNAVRIVFFFLLQTSLVGVIHSVGLGQFWLLFLPLASAAASVFSRRAIVVYYAIVLVVFILPFNWREGTAGLQYMLIFLCALVFVWIFTEVSVRNQQARREVERLARELGEANFRLKESALQAVELARSRERNRLAREIHDSLGHYLTVANVQLEAARALLENKGWRKEAPDLDAALEKAQTLTRGGLADVRKSVAALRADPMGDKPFPEAVRALVEENREAGLLVELRIEGDAGRADPQTELALFRILQEALTNVRKHARASRADVGLTYRADAVRLEVVDNGVGPTPSGDGEEKFGLRGIRERVEILGGKLDLGPDAGGGMRIAVELPLGKK